MRPSDARGGFVTLSNVSTRVRASPVSRLQIERLQRPMRNNASGVVKERLAELDVVRVGHGAAVALNRTGIAGDIVRRALHFR